MGVWRMIIVTMKLLSIILPIYNVEKYVRDCVESIISQGLDSNDYELIIVNDGTKDKSMFVIQDIITSHRNIIVIEQENQGLSVARNNGLANASGKYILMPDSDDLLIDNSLLPFLKKALTTNADMVIANYMEMTDEKIIAIKGSHPIQHDLKVTETTGQEILSEDLCRFYWRTLYKREFLTDNELSFIPGIRSQDVPFTNECLLKAKKCLRTPWLLNIYRRGHVSASSFFSVRLGKDRCIVTAKVWALSKMPELSPETRRKQNDISFKIFCYLFQATTYGHLNNLMEMFEIIDYLKQVAPKLKFQHGLKQRILSFMYRYMPHWLIRISLINRYGKKRMSFIGAKIRG